MLRHAAVFLNRRVGGASERPTHHIDRRAAEFFGAYSHAGPGRNFLELVIVANGWSIRETSARVPRLRASVQFESPPRYSGHNEWLINLSSRRIARLVASDMACPRSGRNPMGDIVFPQTRNHSTGHRSAVSPRELQVETLLSPCKRLGSPHRTLNCLPPVTTQTVDRRSEAPAQRGCIRQVESCRQDTDRAALVGATTSWTAPNTDWALRAHAARAAWASRMLSASCSDRWTCGRGLRGYDRDASTGKSFVCNPGTHHRSAADCRLVRPQSKITTLIIQAGEKLRKQE